MHNQRYLIDQEISEIETLDEESKYLLRECYLQKNTVSSTAIKLNRSTMEVQMWYYKLSMCQMRSAFQNT